MSKIHDKICHMITETLNYHARRGMDAFCKWNPDQPAPVLSHICFKFADLESYRAYKAAAETLGSVSTREFNGKEIAWCRLNAPWQQGNLSLEWVEMVEPRTETHPANTVASIGYAVETIGDPLKYDSDDAGIIYRYQSRHAAQLARG